MNKSQEQLNAEADVVKETTTQAIIDDLSLSATSEGIKNALQPYVSKAKIKTIKFSSRASIKITNNNQDHYYTVEYGEERQIDNFDEVNIDKERQMLIDDCNLQVDNQVKDIVETFLK